MFPDSTGRVPQQRDTGDAVKVHHPLIGVTVAVTAMALAACGPTSQAQEQVGAPHAATSTVPAVVSPKSSSMGSDGDLLRGRVLPLAAYDEPPESVFAIDRAIAILKNNCLARYGFPPLPVPKVATASPPMYRVFGIADPAIAARYGYHLDPVGLAEGAGAQITPTYSASEQLVLLGFAPGHAVPNPENPVPEPTQTYQGKVVPPYGCQGEATKALKPVGVTGEELGLAQSLGVSAWIRSITDPRMTAATARFETCMNAKGFAGHFEDPAEPNQKFDIDKRLTSREIATAVADVDCKRQTKVIDTWFAVDKEYEDAAIQRNLETLTKAKAARDAAVATATRIAGGGS
jgi:hypothetical protein